MAEAALFSLASNLLSRIASPAFEKAYQRAQSIWGAKEELNQLQNTIERIKAVLLDAEERQDCNRSVKIWIKQVRDVLYEADDLFDEVATNDLLIQQMKGNKLVRKVRVSFSELGSSHSIAKKVKAVRSDLDQISNDIAKFSFVQRPNDKPMTSMRRGGDTSGWFVDPELANIGRDDEKKDILKFLFSESDGREISVLTIMGIGGTGKATLARLVYDDVDVQQNFEKRWWACVCNVLDEVEFIGKIFQSITGKFYHGLYPHQLILGIRESIKINGKFLLVLEDLWNVDHLGGLALRDLLSSDDAKGSKVIITARTSFTAMAMGSNYSFHLGGLSPDASWELFKRLAFTQEQANDPSWISLGLKIMEKVGGVPMIIKSIANILYEKTTVQEWNSFLDGELPIDVSCALQLSYDHLSSDLKHCFAYCSLFPVNYTIYKEKLIYLWIAQGYIKPGSSETFEEVGHAYFMDLSRRFFFIEVERDDNDEIVSCKTDHLIRESARKVAGKESFMLTKQLDQSHKKIRHLSVQYERENFSNLPLSLLKTSSRLRSLLFMFGNSCSSLDIDHQLRKLGFLRALDLRALQIEKVPSSIGELKHLRYLGLSENLFKYLPHSITKLLNLLTLDISDCLHLEALPKDFRKLISLRHLDISGCSNLWQMPPRFGDLTSLQHLSDFKVSKSSGGDINSSGLNALVGLNLRGKLRISFDNERSWCGDALMLECGQIPETLEVLRICQYPSMNIPAWWTEDPTSQLPKLVYLALESCPEVEHLPPLRCLPCLKVLKLNNLEKLSYVEGDEFVSTTPFFPSLKRLELLCLPTLKGWSRGLEAVTTQTSRFPHLSHIVIKECFHLKFMPPCPCLQTLNLKGTTKEVLQQLVSTRSLSSSSMSSSSPSSLQNIRVDCCGMLTSFTCEGLTSLRKLDIRECESLKNVQLQENVLEEFSISKCPSFELWDTAHPGVDWGSFPNLHVLSLDEIPEAEMLPDCLRRRIALGELEIRKTVD